MSSGGFLYPQTKQSKPPAYQNTMSKEEDLEGLSGTSEYPAKSQWPRRTVFNASNIFVLLLISGTFGWTLWRAPLARPNNIHYTGSDTRTNGTHEFKRTVVLVSIDGLRADYLDRGLTPHLLKISQNGLRAKSMRPIFPTLTFPNHWALMTGLYAESHGIMANNFWDPVSRSEFWYNRIESCWKSEWWFGEPMWETAEKAGLITANLMWPGPPKTMSGASSTYFVPWKDQVPLKNKHDQIMKWIDLPLHKRPQLITVYEPSLDQAGHKNGPMSAPVNKTLEAVDTFAKELQESLKSRNLTDIVDLVFVSDHGMTDTSNPELVYLDDIIGEEGLKAIEHMDGQPTMGLRFKSTANTTHYLNLLLEASEKNPEKFDVYTHDTMPKRYHFSHHERIAPIYVIPKIGYALEKKAEANSQARRAGNHGYDNEATSMQAMFISHGPFTTGVKALVKARQHEGVSAGWHSTADDTFIMERFQNVEIYNLVMKLLDIESFAASNNGTVGFWDQYL